MPNRITRQDITRSINILNATLAAAGHPARYALEIWSPGDGWSRYQLFDQTRGHYEMSRALTARECYDALICLSKLADTL